MWLLNRAIIASSCSCLLAERRPATHLRHADSSNVAFKKLGKPSGGRSIRGRGLQEFRKFRISRNSGNSGFSENCLWLPWTVFIFSRSPTHRSAAIRVTEIPDFPEIQEKPGPLVMCPPDAFPDQHGVQLPARTTMYPYTLQPYSGGG